MNIKKIGVTLNFFGKNQPAQQTQVQKLDYKIKDTVSFNGKKNNEEPVPYGLDYSEITNLNTKRFKMISELKKSLMNGKDITEERNKLILSRIPTTLEDAKDFISKHKELKNSEDDIIEDLIIIAIETIDEDLASANDTPQYKTEYNKKKEQYLKQLLQEPKTETLDEKDYPYNNQSAQDPIENSIANMVLHDAINNLPDRRKKIIISRYGLDGNETQSLRQLAKNLNCSHSRVMQLEKSALLKIKKAVEETENKE